MLVYDKMRVEDVDSAQEDHGYDSLRYGLMVHRMPTGIPRLEESNDFSRFKGIEETKGSWWGN